MPLREASIAVSAPSVVVDASIKGLLDAGMLSSGAVRGKGPPLVGTLPPRRKDMTLTAKDVQSSFLGIYRQGFARAWRGSWTFCVKAMPQFTAIGPVYLWCDQRFDSPAIAMLGAAAVESTFTFSAQRRSAQIQYNATVPACKHVPHHSAYRVMGAGFTPHVLRNTFAQMGIRWLAPYSYEVVSFLPGSRCMNEEWKLLLSDLTSSVLAAMLSLPFNQLFSWAARTPELDQMSYWQRAIAMSTWLIKNYQKQAVRLLARDLAIRVNYTTAVYTGYRFVERLTVDLNSGSI